MESLYNKIKCFTFGLIAVVSISLSGVYVSQSGFGPAVVEARSYKSDSLQNIFATIAKEKTPAVVNISTKQKIKTGAHGMYDERMREFYQRFPWFQEMPREQERQSLGSGFVVESDGYILTNNHVVAKADEITVTFGDGHTNGKEYPAKLIAADPKLDIALIKIDAGKKLQTLELGDSDKLQVGEWVIAIGNPFGFAQSVTVGVVSAKGRTIGAGPYDNFIQTDASINPGNSGGPLLNTKGQVVGINSAIFTGGASQGNIGIGFAIPINAIHDVYDDLKKGKVKRGWLGVMIQTVTEELKTALGLPSVAGALVGNVFEGSPAGKAGVLRGDVIVEFNGKKLFRSDDLPRIVASVKPGTNVEIKVIRNGKQKSIRIKLGEMPAEKEQGGATSLSENLGMSLTNMTPEIARKLGVDVSEGVVVTEVVPGGPAAKAGFREGIVITEVKQIRVRNIDEYEKVISGAKPGESILFYVRRGNNPSYLVMKMPAEK